MLDVGCVYSRKLHSKTRKQLEGRGLLSFAIRKETRPLCLDHLQVDEEPKEERF